MGYGKRFGLLIGETSDVLDEVEGPRSVLERAHEEVPVAADWVISSGVWDAFGALAAPYAEIASPDGQRRIRMTADEQECWISVWLPGHGELTIELGGLGSDELIEPVLRELMGARVEAGAAHHFFVRVGRQRLRLT